MKREYASFVITSGWRGDSGAVVIAHDQSGEQARVDSVGAAIGWVRGRAGGLPVSLAPERPGAGHPASVGERQIGAPGAGGAG